MLISRRVTAFIKASSPGDGEDFPSVTVLTACVEIGAPLAGRGPTGARVLRRDGATPGALTRLGRAIPNAASTFTEKSVGMYCVPRRQYPSDEHDSYRQHECEHQGES